MTDSSPSHDPMAEGARPLAVDLCCGLTGWGEGLIAAGFDVVGFDIEDMFKALGSPKPDHFQLVLQDVRTLHGSRFRSAELIVASPPCQFFSYTAMPWTRAKALAAEVRADPAKLAERLELFRACFRIQREACEAAGRHIPMVVENVRGAEPWVGRSHHNFGSFYLWGDLPALMPMTLAARKVPGFRFDGSGRSFQSESVARSDTGRKVAGDWFGSYADMKAKGTISPGRQHGKNSAKRKAASAKIAKIPFVLSSWIGRCYLPRTAQPAARAAA